MQKELKRANGSGSVYKLSGRRSRPYIAIITKECNQKNNKYIQKRTPIGYYATRTDALVALSDYIQAPYDLIKRRYTFEQVYNEWSQIHYKEIVPSAVRTWKSAYNYLEPLHNRCFTEIRTKDIDACIRTADVHSSTKNKIKSLCNMLFKYAIRNDITNINYAELCDKIKSDPPVYKRNPFTEEEIYILWDNADKPYVDMLLIAIYTGWRPQELTNILTQDVDLEHMIIRGGMKTKAGYNRIVPIHKDILSLVQTRYEYAISNSLNKLFDNISRPINYAIYNRRFNSLMNNLNMNHRPHDTRHTFVTMAKESNMNDYIIKLIVGHTTQDLTERVYTHRSIETLRREIEKLSVPGR